ncbi:protein ABSCISIC ACID-INSENSITIVE 5 isoform X2 [Solanum dulcamara]|uniref:protein ABSCISIC ACID-INSENSITIVE 5 isoform X2 n=1 Tax=Solanum dulcamara TaxID=45834 RepID=UPI00248618B0|nr:protein ABSCISIC ACID-INSENSITIVE 5 isoform X2 [Solanum dulcamara]
MGVPESEMVSQGEVQSPLQPDQNQHNNHPFPSLGRQASIYSLTLDEFQHTVCESGKNFGSMNMDEFLNSIWTAEENHAHAHAHAQPHFQAASTGEVASAPHFALGQGNVSLEKAIVKQPSLPRQGSLTLPAPLCRKTVDEVWSEIHKSQKDQQQNNEGRIQNTGNGSSTQRQATFGEMTLEDFLVKAGVVREQGNSAPAPPQQQSYMMYQNSANPTMARPVIGLGGVAGGVGVGVAIPGYPPLPQTGVVDAHAYPISMKRGSGFPQQPTPVYSGRMGNGSGVGYGQVVQGVAGMGSPLSPVSSDGLCVNQIDSGSQYGLDIGMRGGRKRILDGPVERVVERRQRRMIKNRESAARSRARKQAYTVELEAELNQLKEENAHLKQALVVNILAEMSLILERSWRGKGNNSTLMKRK